MFKTYYQLTKPGIIYGNALTTVGGFLLASRGHIHFWLLLTTLVGASLVIASGCVFNNYIDRDIDQKMARTKKRALVSGLISGRAALIYASVLGVVGFTVLAIFVNWLVVFIGAVGFIDYVILYGFSKRRSTLGTIVGSISGAAPVVAGYCAVTNRFDLGALLLFVIMVIWQMPHFYAIAMYRSDDYRAAGIPVLPIVKGARTAKLQMLAYIAVFIVTLTALALDGYASRGFGVIMIPLSLYWLYLAIKGLGVKDDIVWAKQLFRFSLIIVLALSVMLSVSHFLP